MPNNTLSLEESLGYVKKYHPIIKQAKLIVNTNQAKLLKARGGFDPKIEVDYSNKNFKNTEYYKTLVSSFKIPTWYGIELKASYENNSGKYLNPQYKTPKNGLYNVGVSVSLAKNLFINKRMATLKKAKIYTKQSKLEQQLLVNTILFDAISAYLNWTQYYQQYSVFQNYYANATIRHHNVIKNFKAGDKAAVDTLETSINLENRKLDLEKARIKHLKSKVAFSNYLWINNNIPMELKNNMIPDIATFSKIDKLLKIVENDFNKIDENDLEQHPKLKLLALKKNNLQINKRLKINNLLPKIDFQYNLLSSEVHNFDSFNASNYKNSLQVSVPLFLRKSRGDLKIAKIKLQDLDFEISSTKIILQNKIKATKQEIVSYEKQHNILQNLVNNYKRIVKSEERKFSLGESSLFLINYREVKLIETNLKAIKNEYEYAKTKSKLLKLLGKLTNI
ncbi:TolC family protein [Tenacibaculum piscium]|uniref:TolC family protein n=1 Tax=Tenacibaculum piscium TaxID=1458515 RepID=UPI001EFB2DFE|nr:TolC family protein [Tenacibaculum piscium]MCG8183650.1 TolC family protein [Tenacibaculum piscium]MCG8204863.1 TolC family protein [Tenacibaculum piscium]